MMKAKAKAIFHINYFCTWHHGPKGINVLIYSMHTKISADVYISQLTDTYAASHQMAVVFVYKQISTTIWYEMQYFEEAQKKASF